MSAVRTGVLQLNPTIGDFTGNVSRLLDAYAAACARGAELVVAPELYLSGYPPRDLLLRRDFVDANLDALQNAALHIGAVPLVVGYVDRADAAMGRPLRNAAAVLMNGRVAWRGFKTLLPDYDVFDETRYFEPAESVAPFEFRGWRIGITICEDIWNDADFWPQRRYRRDPVKELLSQGANMIVNLSASPWHLGKETTRRQMLAQLARDEQVPVVFVNMVGGNDELIFDGASLVFDRSGRLIASGRAFEEDVFVVDVQQGGPVVPDPAQQPEELLAAALTLGLRDYVRKCGFRSAVLGLSGGIDSALVALLAADALGPDNVLCVALPSRYSSRASLDDARALATNLGVRFEIIPIEQMFTVAESTLAAVFAGRAADVTEENIQARLRGVVVMALSNKFGHLALTTGNKSELATGYCTLYGDMCGGLGVIGDLYKTQVYRLARWLNARRRVIPESIFTKPPSAELRPNQTDQDTLPPYEVLDSILELLLEDGLGVDQIVERGFEKAVVVDVVNRVVASEFKRRQAAPVLKVSRVAFGFGRRIPIAQRFKLV